jgi:hypothetical protein
VQTRYMDRYKNAGKSIRHYVNISGWNGHKTVLVNDPNYDDRFFGSRWEAVGSGTKNGIFKATWEADKFGENHALVH